MIRVELDLGNAGEYTTWANQPKSVEDLRTLAAELLHQADKAQEALERVAARAANVR